MVPLYKLVLILWLNEYAALQYHFRAADLLVEGENVGGKRSDTSEKLKCFRFYLAASGRRCWPVFADLLK